MKIPALLGLLLAAGLADSAHGQPASDLPHRDAREAPSWARDAVLYEVFPRAFSPTGDLQPGGAIPERRTRPANLPQLQLDAWGVRILQR